jgi:hypothetical protein
MFFSCQTKGMMKIDVNYYKSLFGFEEKLDIYLANDFWSIDDLVSGEQNRILDADFSEKGIREAVFGSYAEGAPGPDGISFLFYQHFWELVKKDFMAMVYDSNNRKLDLFRLNFSLLALIPKEADDVSM